MATDKPQLWIVCASPLTDSNERVVVSITSDGPHITDRTCPVEIADHNFIKHRSYALFRKAKVVTIGDLSSGFKNKHHTIDPPAPAALVERIRVAALASLYTPRDVKECIRNCASRR